MLNWLLYSPGKMYLWESDTILLLISLVQALWDFCYKERWWNTSQLLVEMLCMYEILKNLFSKVWTFDVFSTAENCASDYKTQTLPCSDYIDYSILHWFTVFTIAASSFSKNTAVCCEQRDCTPWANLISSNRSNSGCVFGLHASCLSVWISVTCVHIIKCVRESLPPPRFLCATHVPILFKCAHVSMCARVYVCVWPASHCRLLIKSR